MPMWLYLANEVFLPWRMPTLMFLSGLLLQRSLAKPLGEYFGGKARNLLWPYFLWAAVHILTFPHFEGSFFSPGSWVATGYLWFIFFMFIYYIIAPVVVRVPWWVSLPAFTVAAFAVPIETLARLAFLATFFFAGYYARNLLSRVATASSRWLLGGFLISAAFTGLSLHLSAATESHFFQYAAMSTPAVFVLLATSIRIVAAVDTKFGRGRSGLSAWVRGLRAVGRSSIVYYLTHFPVIASVSAIALGLGIPIGVWIVPVGLAAALAVGFGLSRVRTVAPFSWLFTAPQVFRRAKLPGAWASRGSATEDQGGIGPDRAV